MASALAYWKRFKWIKPDESLSAGGCFLKLGFDSEQLANHCMAINQENPKRRAASRGKRRTPMFGHTTATSDAAEKCLWHKRC